MSFDLPADTILPVTEVRVRLEAGPHPFETDHTAEIAQNWRREKAATPALYDGRVALLSALGLDGDVLHGRCHIVRYATFLLWRRMRPTGGAGHAYTHPMLVSADGALIAVRMAAATANAGSVYFAAGSFEEADFRDGLADPRANMHREVLEETGIDLAGVRRERGFHLLSRAEGTVLFCRYFLDGDADAVAASIRAHIAGQRDPEIAEPVVIEREGAWPDGLAAQMPDLIRWHFGAA